MKILIIHNSYQIKGGEDAVVDSEYELLKNGGHEVELVVFNNDSIKGLKAKVTASLQVFYSGASKRTVGEVVHRFRPDVIHVHNFFPLVTPSVYDVAIENNIPVVQTLHNFRILCPNGLFLLKGETCERCIGGSFYHAAINKCYRESFVGSATVAAFDYYHRYRNTWNTKVSAFIALTGFSKSKFIEGGIDESIIRVKPNFVAPVEYKGIEREGFGLYVGRLSQEKGVRVLVEAARDLQFPIKVVGDGPLKNEVVNAPGIEYLGRKSQGEVAEMMQRAMFLIVPSICYENFPRTIAEAFSNRLPVIGSNHGSVKEIVDDGVNGLLFEPGSASHLREKLVAAFNDSALMLKMGQKAYQTFAENYTPSINLRQLIDIYESTMKDKHNE